VHDHESGSVSGLKPSGSHSRVQEPQIDLGEASDDSPEQFYALYDGAVERGLDGDSAVILPHPQDAT
jgi:hypothetical protein